MLIIDTVLTTQADSPNRQNTCVVSVSFSVMRTVALHEIGSWRNIRFRCCQDQKSSYPELFWGALGVCGVV